MRMIFLAATALAVVAAPAAGNALPEERQQQPSDNKGADRSEAKECFGTTRATIAAWLAENGYPHGHQIRNRKGSIPDYDDWWIEEHCLR